MRADLMANLRKFMKAKKITQSIAVEMLIILATKAGMRVTLKIAE
jgi:hypothetical protein